MRLSRIQIEEISRLILRRLKDAEMVTINAPEEKVLQRIAGIITKDMMAEDELDKEVKKLLEVYEAKFRSGELEYMKMFNKAKEKLVKERDLII